MDLPLHKDCTGSLPHTGYMDCKGYTGSLQHTDYTDSQRRTDYRGCPLRKDLPPLTPAWQ